MKRQTIFDGAIFRQNAGGQEAGTTWGGIDKRGGLAYNMYGKCIGSYQKIHKDGARRYKNMFSLQGFVEKTKERGINMDAVMVVQEGVVLGLHDSATM